jgi:unsaturated chondroitin disaccharide hydrolase
MMRRALVYSAVVAAICSTSISQAAPPFYIVALDSAKSQLNRLAVSLGTAYTQFPRTFTNGNVTTVAYGDWTSGFFPGCLWLMYKYTGDATWATRARTWTNNLANAATVNDHDVGFRIMSSYGKGLEFQTAAQIKLDTAVMMQAARTLRGRYNATVKAIKSWDSYLTYNYPVIIDNMMNLELLTWATRTGKDSSFQKDAVSHANTTRKNHFRSNYSSYHLVAYNTANGAVIAKMTVQGYANESSWARGQSWGLYGYTMMYRETHDTAYLNQAAHIADYIISRLPTPTPGNVPYWDYDVPTSPTPSRDASAAAICASALIELSTFVPGAAGQAYYQKAIAILQNLASTTYTTAPNTNGNFILMHSTGHHPAGTEIDVPIIYADYYYLEALLRLKAIEETAAAEPASSKNGSGFVRGTLKAYPLGHKGIVRIDIGAPAKDPILLRIVDIRGRTVMEQSVHAPGTTLDLSCLRSGCYTAEASGGPAGGRGFFAAARLIHN